MASTGITSLLTMISQGKGMATSNNFGVEIIFPNSSVVGSSSWSYKNTGDTDETRMMVFCDEASLPGYQLNTGSVNRYSGTAPVYYPVGPIYNDIQLSFMCDAKMTPLHLLNRWMRYIFVDSDDDGTEFDYRSSEENGRRLRYPEEYQAKIILYKTERSTDSENGAISSSYYLYDAWPYTIDQTPLSYGSSQLVKVTANFYYRRWKLGKDQLVGRR
jgi:hypothetical protein